MKRYASYQETGILWNTNIPAHWKLYRGKRMFFTEKHLNVDRAENNILSLTLNGVVRNNGDKPIGLSPADYSTYQIFEKDNLVFKLIDLNNISTSRVGLVPERGIMSSAYIRLIPRFEVNIRYFYMQYYDLWLRNIFNGLGAGVRQTLGAKELLELEIAVPPREEQDQIVRFLDWKVSSINKLINIKREQLNKTKELLDRLFREITSECSKKVKIKYLFELENDFFIPDASELYAKAGMYNRGRGIFLREPCPGKDLGDSQFQRIHSNRLMLSGQFAWEDAVYITQGKDTAGIASHRYYLLKPIKDVSVEYLWAYFLSCEGFFYLQQCSHGSAGRNRPLNIKEVFNLELPVPVYSRRINVLNKVVRNYMRQQVLME